MKFKFLKLALVTTSAIALVNCGMDSVATDSISDPIADPTAVPIESYSSAIVSVESGADTSLTIPGSSEAISLESSSSTILAVSSSSAKITISSSSTIPAISSSSAKHTVSSSSTIPVISSSSETIAASSAATCYEPAQGNERARMIVTSDIGGSDPDDIQSLVHLMTMLNDVDLEGIISQHAWVPYGTGADAVIEKVIAAYEQVLPNLRVHDQNFPDASYLRSIVKIGQPKAAMADVGDGKDSDGSNWIIKVVDENDSRPVWISAWSGLNTLAQALWKVQHSRSTAETAKFVSKIRVYDVLGQDDAGAWIVKNFPDLIYIRNKSVYGWPESESWYKTNIQSAGALGSAYPDKVWAIEGDSPAFLYCVNNGLNDPEHIDYGGWGGRFSTSKTANIEGMDWVKKSNLNELQYAPYYMYGSASEGVGAINKWKSDIHADFKARMQWSINSNYSSANHHPVAIVNKDGSRSIISISASNGQTVQLNTECSYDPDGDELVYDWSFYKEPSTYKGSVSINGGANASFTVPSDASGKSIHIILRLSDKRNDALTSYRRIVVNVK